MNHHCACLASILGAVQARCLGLEARLGVDRSARLVGWMGEAAVVGEILRTWVLGVAMEYTKDPDVLCAVRILLDLFVAEARESGVGEYSGVRVFFMGWIQRCVLRLGTGMVVGELVWGVCPIPVCWM